MSLRHPVIRMCDMTVYQQDSHVRHDCVIALMHGVIALIHTTHTRDTTDAMKIHMRDMTV